MPRSHSDSSINSKPKSNIFNKIRLRYQLLRVNMENLFLRSHRSNQEPGVQYGHNGSTSFSRAEERRRTHYPRYSDSDTEHESSTSTTECYRRERYIDRRPRLKPRAVRERRQRSSRTRSSERKPSLKEIRESTSAKGDDKTLIRNDSESDMDHFGGGGPSKFMQEQHRLTRTSTVEFIPQGIENVQSNRKRPLDNPNAGIRSPPSVHRIQYSHNENVSSQELSLPRVHLPIRRSEYQHPEFIQQEPIPQYPIPIPNELFENSYTTPAFQTSTVKTRNYKNKKIPNAISSTLFRFNKSSPNKTKNKKFNPTNLLKLLDLKTYRPNFKREPENEINVGVGLGFVFRNDKVVRYRDIMKENRNPKRNEISGYGHGPPYSSFNTDQRDEFIPYRTPVPVSTNPIPHSGTMTVMNKPQPQLIVPDINNNDVNFSKRNELKAFLKRTFVNSIEENETVNLHVTGLSSIFNNKSYNQEIDDPYKYSISKPTFQNPDFENAQNNKFPNFESEYGYGMIMDKKNDATFYRRDGNGNFLAEEPDPRSRSKVTGTKLYTPKTTFTSQFSHLLPGSPNFYPV